MRAIIIILCFLSAIQGVGQTTRIDQAQKLYQNRKYQDAAKLLEPVSEGEKDYAAAQYWLGRVAFDQGKFDDAQDYFEEAVETNDKVADYQNWLGNTYGTIAKDANVFKQGMLAPKMKNAWEKAIALDPNNIDARISLIQYYTQAPGFMGGSVEKTKVVAGQIVKLNPAQGHRQLGNILVSEKKAAEAEKEFQEMVRIDPAYTQVLANFYVNQKQYDKAFGLFDELLKKNPDDYVAIYLVGRTAAVTGQRLDQGEECLKKYLTYTPKANEPSHGGANMRLAQIHEKRGNKAEAMKYYQTALAMDGSLKEAKEGLERTSR